MLADVFGYDKYSEVTRELCIRGTFCDLATRIDGKFQLLREVKAIGLDLKDAHVQPSELGVPKSAPAVLNRP